MNSNEVVTKRRKRLTKEEWQKHLEAWQVSHQTQKQYCEGQGISEKALKNQRYRQRKRCTKNETVAPQETQKAPRQTHAEFAPIKLLAPATESVSVYEIQFPSGVLIKVPQQETLSSVIKSLEAYL